MQATAVRWTFREIEPITKICASRTPWASAMTIHANTMGTIPRDTAAGAIVSAVSVPIKTVMSISLYHS